MYQDNLSDNTLNSAAPLYLKINTTELTLLRSTTTPWTTPGRESSVSVHVRALSTTVAAIGAGCCDADPQAPDALGCVPSAIRSGGLKFPVDIQSTYANMPPEV